MAALIPTAPALAALLLAGTARPQEEATRIDCRVSPVVDLWFAARAASGPQGPPGTPARLREAPRDPALAAAARAMDTLEAELGSPLVLGALEGLLGEVEDAEQLALRFESLPETMRLPEPTRVPGRPAAGGGERTVELRRLALETAAALADAEATWLEEEWPARRARLEAARERMEAAFAGPGTPLALADACGALAIPLGGDVDLPLYLVLDMPWPGGVTHRTPGGEASFVAVGEGVSSELLEVSIHEVLHQLDERSRGAETLPELLRASLAAVGASPREASSLPHLLLFLAAADATRAHLDAEHVDYGEARGVYGRMGPGAVRVRAAWAAWRAGELDARGFAELAAGGAR